MAFGIKLFWAFMGHILINEIPTFYIDGHINALWRPLHKFSKTLLHTIDDGERICFQEDIWLGDQHRVYNFFGFHTFIIVKNLTISVVLGNSSSLSWNLNFRHNLIDMDIKNYESLMPLLTSVHLPPSTIDSRVMSLSHWGLLSVKSFF